MLKFEKINSEDFNYNKLERFEDLNKNNEEIKPLRIFKQSIS
jgi:hypothetical protein